MAAAPASLTLHSAPDAIVAPAVALAAQARGGVTLFIGRDESRAQSAEALARFFTPELATLRLPAWDNLPYDRISPASEIAAQRCAALAALAQRKKDAGPLLVISTASAVAQRAPPRHRIAQAAFYTRVGEVASMEGLERYLIVNGYGRASTVRAPGDFAMRGGVVDVFSPGAPEPIRFDFFGDQLESIRAFDPETQRTTRQLTDAMLTPVSEVLLDDESVHSFRKRFAESFGVVTDAVYDSVSARIRRQGVEQWLPFFYDRLETIFDYAGPDALIAFDSMAEDAARERVEAAVDHYETRKATPTPRGTPPFRAPPPEALYLGPDALNDAIGARPTLRFSSFAAPEGQNALSLGAHAGRSFAAERATADANVFDIASRHIAALTAEKKRVIVAAWSDGSAERLKHVLEDHAVKDMALTASWAEASALKADRVAVAVLPIEHGFETDALAIVAEQDILGDRLARQRKKRRASSLIAEAAALSPGDYVVHEDHGIGRYDGLKTLDVQGAPHDCLDLTYLNNDKLYLPVENIELISRYGSEDASAQLDKLGGAGWQGRKARAKQRLRDMAEELIRIAAERASRTAEEVTAPEGLYDEFCARFPYEETDDQLAAIEDVMTDLAAGRPMDRLICGDVGFGKTEVALRAAFLVAMTGKQVAVIAPTTLLCRQHFKTFEERFRGLPVRVRQLSRLVPAKTATETRAGLSDGTVEIVIGTHALLSKQVAFRDLGLMIIDEEQHFGVKHKERLKELRADVHVLTLSATPIPRTLQMALAGIRELSIIATPPIDRMAVRTYVTPFDAVTIREALLREKYRGGQSFYVVPRISDLEETADFLRKQAPEVSFIAAHGQMPPTTLDDLMSQFYDGACDVLVSTTIVESGLDIPRANTLIVHRADMFGLAQLYQLRGRVGRSKVRAYAYLTTPAEQTLTAGAEKRLKVLSSLDNLGAGFTLASHDLDMRGGGNLLGEEQSGHIKEVGVELYQSMLEEAVQAVREGREDTMSARSWSPAINVGVAVLIPEEYVPDLTVRLGLYRRLADLDTDQEREAFASELIDRFGPLPQEADQLIGVTALKALCRRASIARLDAGPKGAVLTFRDNGFPEPAALVRYIQSRPFDFRMRPDGKLVVTGEWPDPVLRLKALRASLEGITQLAMRAAA
ncbi:MAG: transcription-repair coupling factor [Alphaproteobacteria bacterium]|nr:transcription-repair coupling factor [Alphaproteobacteria bacterium]